MLNPIHHWYEMCSCVFGQLLENLLKKFAMAIRGDDCQKLSEDIPPRTLDAWSTGLTGTELS